ncbi:MAG: pepsin/retropepsin-like aspartic protease family protein [Candidatus Binataceae bacterium]
MPVVNYSLEAAYLRATNGKSYPGLIVAVEKPGDSSRSFEVRAELDSGAEYSLFDGEMAAEIGLDLHSGKPFTFETATGARIYARILQVTLRHADLGTFDLPLRFSTSRIRRDVLGRDFFDLIQIGFRERHLTIYLNATP